MNEDEVQPLSTMITIKEEEKSKSLTQPTQITPFYSTQAEAALIHEHKTLKICKLCIESFDLLLIDEKGNKIEIDINENNYNPNDDNILLNNELISEEQEELSEKINDIISKTIPELESIKEKH